MALNKMYLPAYCKVYGVDINTAKQQEDNIAEIVAEASIVVSTHMNLLPEETEEMRDERLACKEGRQGNINYLGDLLKRQRNISGEVSPIEMVLEMYKYIQENEKGGNENMSENPITKLKEMTGGNTAGNENINPQGENAPVTPEANKVSERKVTPAEQQAINQEIKNSENSRRAWTENSRVKSVIISKPHNKDLIDKSQAKQEGEQIIGVINDAAKHFQSFKQKFGASEENGTVKFTKLGEDGDMDNAREIYQILKDAANGKVKELPVYLSESDGTIAGFIIQEADSQETRVLKGEDAAALILEKGIVFVPFEGSNDQLQIAEIKPRGDANNKQKAKLTKAKSIKGIVAVRITNKKDVVAKVGKFLQEKTSVVEDMAKVKSVLFARYLSDKKDSNDNYKKVTYRIPLTVPMFKLEIVDDALKCLKSETARGTQIIGLDKAMEEFQAVAKAITASGIENKLTSKIKQLAQAEESKATENLQNEMMGGDNLQL